MKIYFNNQSPPSNLRSLVSHTKAIESGKDENEMSSQLKTTAANFWEMILGQPRLKLN
jgi:hypothetical protein